MLLFAPLDYSGSFYKWAEAINRYTGYAARLVTCGRHPYGYSLDLLFPAPSIREGDGDLLRLMREADIVHVKDETGFMDGSNGLPEGMLWQVGKPIVFTHYGGYARKWKDVDTYIRFVSEMFDARVSMTPDLCFPWFDGCLIPHAIDASKYEFCWRDGQRVAHSPSTASRKGTAELLEAMASLTDDLGIEFDLIQKVSHAECIERKRNCNLFFDQAGKEQPLKLGISDVIGWYGNSALEAAVHGIPTIAHLSEQAFQGGERCGVDLRECCPILNTPLGPDGIRKTIVEFFNATVEHRQQMAEATRRWVEEFHSYQAVGKMLENVYDGLLDEGQKGGNKRDAIRAA